MATTNQEQGSSKRGTRARSAATEEKKTAPAPKVDKKRIPRPKVQTADGVPELAGIKDPKKPITHQDIWDFVKKHAGDHTHNVEIVPLDNVVFDAERPLPFTRMEQGGRRANVMWALINGVGDEHDRRLSTFLKAALAQGMSTKRCQDLVAALNGGYSESSKQWGTPFVKLRVVQKAMKEAAKPKEPKEEPKEPAKPAE